MREFFEACGAMATPETGRYFDTDDQPADLLPIDLKRQARGGHISSSIPIPRRRRQ